MNNEQRYKIGAPVETNYKIKDANTSRSFKVLKVQDVVNLEFDEDNQMFYATISEPSQHTKYLFSQGRLGICLCRLNTGYSQRKKMCSWYDQDERIYAMPLKHHCHPRWSRCGNNFKLVTNLTARIPISFTADQLEPNQKHTLRDTNTRWFTAVKALLLSCPPNPNEQELQGGNAVCKCRGYKTMSNRIKVEYDKEDYWLYIRTGRIPKEDKYKISNVAITLNNRTYGIDINLTELSSYLQEKADPNLSSGGIYCALEMVDCGITNHVHSKNTTYRARNGYENNHYEAELHRRWKYRQKDDGAGRYYCWRGGNNFRRLSNSGSTIYINYTVPNSIDVPAGSRVKRLLKLFKRHNDYSSTITVHLNLVLMVKEHIYFHYDSRHSQKLGKDTYTRIYKVETPFTMSWTANDI